MPLRAISYLRPRRSTVRWRSPTSAESWPAGPCEAKVASSNPAPGSSLIRPVMASTWFEPSPTRSSGSIPASDDAIPQRGEPSKQEQPTSHLHRRRADHPTVTGEMLHDPLRPTDHPDGEHNCLTWCKTMTDRNSPGRRCPPPRGRPTPARDGWRWSNVPVPEAHVYLGIVALVTSVVRPRRISWPLSRPVGWTLVVAGVTVAVWATRAAGRTDLVRPDRVVADGPYALSRHPMYVAWTAIYLGVALAARAGWPLLLSPLLVVLIRREIEREEERLTEAFGTAYVAYQARVRRYL